MNFRIRRKILIGAKSIVFFSFLLIALAACAGQEQLNQGFNPGDIVVYVDQDGGQQSMPDAYGLDSEDDDDLSFLNPVPGLAEPDPTASSVPSSEFATVPRPAAAGLYALIPDSQPFRDEVLTSPYIVGVSIRQGWRDVEPVEGQYQWGYLDARIGEAKAAGKLVMLRVVPDFRVPDWVYQAGAKKFSFWDFSWNHPTYGQLLTIPLPWDPVFLNKWTRFVRALGTRYSGESSVVIVQMGGPSRYGGEMNLTQTDEEAAALKALGYTPYRLFSSWMTCIDAYAAAFPAKLFAVDVAKPVDSDDVVWDIASYGINRYPGRFCVQHDALKETTNPTWSYQKLVAASSAWTVTGYQMISAASYGGGGWLGKPGNLGRAMTIGLNAGAWYFEIYAPDVLNRVYVPALVKAAARLKSGRALPE